MGNAGVPMVYSTHITPAKHGEEKLQIPLLHYGPTVGGAGRMTKFSLVQCLWFTTWVGRKREERS
jgi:hypothetical protein